MEVTIRTIKKPETSDMNESIRWLCNALGLSKGRDIDKTSSKLFIYFIRNFGSNDVIAPDVIARDMGMARSTIIHHLQRYEKAGILIKTKGGYELRERSLEEVIREIERDVKKEFEKMIEIAREIDKMRKKL